MFTKGSGGEMPCLPCNQIWARMWAGGRALFLPHCLVLDGYSGRKDLAWSAISNPANTQKHPPATTTQLFPRLQMGWALKQTSSWHSSFNSFRLRGRLTSSQFIFTGRSSSAYKNSYTKFTLWSYPHTGVAISSETKLTLMCNIIGF